MANEVLKGIFQEMQTQLVGFKPDPIMDALFSKKVIDIDDIDNLRHSYQAPRDRCRELLLLLHRSPHPQAFIHLRLTLLDEYSWFVDQIDKKLPSLASQLQQLHLVQSTDGKPLYEIIGSFFNTYQNPTGRVW